ncbi:MAG: HEPN domain-containing protein [Magnetococcus sp. DMHC-6]
MSIEPENLINLAEKLVNDGTEEVDFRCAVSRAYYAIYHVYKPLAEKLPPASTNGRTGMHQALIDRFLESSHNDDRSIGLKMKKFKEARTEADYKLFTKFSQQKAKETIIKIEEMLKQFKKNLSESAR